MIVILLGAPGSGKGTQSKTMCAKYGFKHLATGDIFREEIANKSSLGQKAQEYVKSGRLVPDNVTTEMVAGRIDFDGTKYLLDGFPRNLAQAQELDKILAPQKSAISSVIYLNLPLNEAVKRLSSRRICAKCGEVYSVLTRAPKMQGKCDACGGDVIQRDDDSEATVRKRLMLFEDVTQPLVSYYKAEQVFHEVNGAQTPEKVSADFFAVIDGLAAAK
jgi:adenylate kinase